MLMRLIILLNAVAFTLAYSQDDPGQPLDNETANAFKQCLKQVGNYTEIEKYLDNEEIYFYVGPDTDREQAFYAIKDCLKKYNVYIQLGVAKGQGKNYDEGIYVDLLTELQDYQPKEMVEYDNGIEPIHLDVIGVNIASRSYSDDNSKRNGDANDTNTEVRMFTRYESMNPIDLLYFHTTVY